MLPEFQDNGYLPPGVHLSTLDEIDDRFGQGTEIRRAQMDSLRWLVGMARRVGILRMIINGSFVTDVPEPNDVDCALLIPDDLVLDPDMEIAFEVGLPFLQIEMVTTEDFDLLVNRIFASDRRLQPKGVVEIHL